MATTLKQFLDKDPQVKAARKKAQAARAELQRQQQALAAAGARADANTIDLINRRIEAAQAELNKQSENLSLVEANRTDYFSKNKKAIRTEERETTVAEAKQELEDLLQQRRQDPRIAGPVIDARIQDLNEKINQTGKYAPKSKVTEEAGAVVTPEGAAKELRNYQLEAQNAFKTVRAMSPAQRKALITSLKNAGYNPPNVFEVYTDQLANEYLKAIGANQIRSKQFGEISFNEFLAEKTIENNALKKSGAGGGLTTLTDTDVDIVRKTKGQIDQDISEIAIKVLGRDISDEDKAEDWYQNLVNSIGKMYEKGTKTVTTSSSRTGDGRTVSGSKRIVTPSVAEADIDALIERRLRQGDPESVGRKERLDFVSWMNKALGD
jgi:hypothetical protein